MSLSPVTSFDRRPMSFGTLEVKVLETKNIKCHFINAKVEDITKLSDIKKNAAAAHQFTDSFSFKASTKDAELQIEAWKKNMIMKDKLAGALSIPIEKFVDEQVHNNWYPLVRPIKKKPEKAPGDPADVESPRDASAVASPRKEKKKKEGEVRLEIKFTRTIPPKEVLKGIVLEDKWTTETAGGSLVNNRYWRKNPQFLLSVESAAEVHIKLRQPDEDAIQRVSFYVVFYDEFYDGRRKVVMDTDEIIKVENFLCPIAATAVDSTYKLECGDYVIIPFPEDTGYVGNFTLAASAKSMEDIGLIKLPKSQENVWKELSCEGEWTDETSGGGDILGLNWRKNPQFAFTLKRQSDVCVVVEQDDITRSIGCYVIKQQDEGKKAVEYSHEVGKTESCKFVLSTGIKMPNLSAGSYIAIPCTFDMGVIGPFQMLVYANDPEATLSPIAHQWKYAREIRTEWKDGQSGGSPNHGTHLNNPQFSLIIPKVDHPVNILIQLIQESAHYEETSIGFLMVKAPNDTKGRLTENFGAEEIFCKPEGWVPKVDVVCRATINADQNRVYTIIPSTFVPNVHRSFNLNVFSDDEISLEQL